GERIWDSAALAHPRKRAAGVETAGEGDAHALADRQRGKDDALRCGVDAHAAPCRRCAWSSSASSLPVTGSRDTSMTVFSPAIVPAMCGCRATSIACASALA